MTRKIDQAYLVFAEDAPFQTWTLKLILDPNQQLIVEAGLREHGLFNGDVCAAKTPFGISTTPDLVDNQLDAMEIDSNEEEAGEIVEPPERSVGTLRSECKKLYYAQKHKQP